MHWLHLRFSVYSGRKDNGNYIEVPTNAHDTTVIGLGPNQWLRVFLV